MFGEVLLIGAYWGPRKEGVDVCASRAAECLASLKHVHPIFATWCPLPSRKNNATTRRISIDAASLKEHLLSGINYTDVGKRPMMNLGYRISFLNCEDSASRVQFSLTCDGVVPRLSNLCLLEFPNYNPKAITPQQVIDALRTLILAWNPETAVVTCHALKEAIVPEGKISDAGWIMFRRGQSPKPSELPAGARVEQISDRGSVIIADDEITLPPSASQIEAVRQVVKSASDET